MNSDKTAVFYNKIDRYDKTSTNLRFSPGLNLREENG